MGLLANPSSGYDVRRLVSSAETVTNLVKVNRIARFLSGLRVLGPCRVLFMPERLNLVQCAFKSLQPLEDRGSLQSGLVVEPVELKPQGTPDDTLAATRMMCKSGCNLLITFGGDGTNRLVAMESGQVPLLPISAGTNNIFPLSCEGTRAGLVAGIFLKMLNSGTDLPSGISVNELVQQQKLLLAETDSWSETALIDLAISRQVSVGGRAIWDANWLEAVFVTRCAPGASGLCGIPGGVMDIPPLAPHGAAAFLGNRFSVQAVLTPGKVQSVGLEAVERMNLHQLHTMEVSEGTVLADGERVRELHNEKVRITLHPEGPRVLDFEATLAAGLQHGYFQI